MRTAECYCLPYFRTECFYRAFGNQHPQYRLAEYCCGQNDYARASAGGLHPGKLAKTAVELLQPERQAQMQSDLAYMKHRLGEPGAVNRVAQLILKMTEERK